MTFPTSGQILKPCKTLKEESDTYRAGRTECWEDRELHTCYQNIAMNVRNTDYDRKGNKKDGKERSRSLSVLGLPSGAMRCDATTRRE